MMFRFMTTAVVAMGLLVAAGCDEADYDADPDAIGIEATEETYVPPADPLATEPADDDDVVLQKDTDVQLLETDLQPPDANQPPAAATGDDAVEEVPAATLPETQQQPEQQQPEP